MAYQDFTVKFEPISDSERYRLVTHSPGEGQAAANFALPFGAERIHSWRSGLDPVETRIIGTLMYRRLFSPGICKAFQSTQRFAAQQGLSLRLNLALDDKLARLPWEFLFDPDSGQFLCLGGRLALVRLYPVPSAHKPIRLKPDLEVCVAEVDDDAARSLSYLPPPLASGAVRARKFDIPESQGAAPETLSCQILHLRAVAGSDPQGGEYALRFSDGAGEQWLSADKLARWLRDHPSIQLVVVDPIMEAESTAPDGSAFAAALVARQMVPAVVTLQYALPPRLRETFFKAFYSALCQDAGLDLAVTEGRQALSAMNAAWEWGAPVLYSALRNDQSGIENSFEFPRVLC